MAHSNKTLLETLIRLIDSVNNNIYIHLDLKCTEFTPADIDTSILKSKVKWVEDRTDVVWGGYSMILAELKLFELSSQDNNEYYHLLSGVDLPLVPQDKIYEFFSSHNGLEFISYGTDEFMASTFFRYKYYHFLQDKIKNWQKNKIKWAIDRSFAYIQHLLHVNRCRHYTCEMKTGSNWVSITHDLVIHILSQRPLIEKMFKYTLCCDEVFVQTIAFNSHFRERLYEFDNRSGSENMRYIRWTGGDSPKTLDINDYKEIKDSGLLFARKFSIDSPEQKLLVNKVIKELNFKKFTVDQLGTNES